MTGSVLSRRALPKRPVATSPATEAATQQAVSRVLAEPGTRFLYSELDRRGLEPAHPRRRGRLRHA